MNPDGYQIRSSRYAIFPEDHTMQYLVLGLCSEAGELASKLKKQIRDETPITKQDLSREVGDVLWYCAQILTANGIYLEDCMKANIEKLESRLQRGTLQGSGDHR
ncbi:MAG: nucleoside triphosphate pyrophosphohydrolase family protein [Candidatus Omnitrophica bacterium]|nr:nucleoside triphosphate pyrophosphohydrolase family protein [Candidatus Omnitrophota bacterium]